MIRDGHMSNASATIGSFLSHLLQVLLQIHVLQGHRTAPGHRFREFVSTCFDMFQLHLAHRSAMALPWFQRAMGWTQLYGWAATTIAGCLIQLIQLIQLIPFASSTLSKTVLANVENRFNIMTYNDTIMIIYGNIMTILWYIYYIMIINI